MNTIKLYTLGCKVNQYETQAIRESLLAKGLKEVNSKTKADIYLINSCTVTSRADKKSRDLISKAFNENPAAKVILTGCFIQDRKSQFINDNRVIIVRNEHKDKISEYIGGITQGEKDAACDYLDLSISDFKGHNRAFIKIQDGCDNACAYCKIPLVRGRSRSRPIDSIKQEAKRLIDHGFSEIVLTGICLGMYGRDFADEFALSDVVTELINLDGEFRIRLSSIEARDISDRLIDLLASTDKLCRHLHIPFQSGDNQILDKMNRNYSQDDYLRLVERLRIRMPDIAITTDIMVGFPSEGDDNFSNTFYFLEKIAPSRMHIFPFSPREGTPAYNLKESVPSHKMRARIDKLNELAKRISFDYRYKFLDRELQVLAETQKANIDNYLKGYSSNYINVLFDGPDNLINKLVRVKVKDVNLDYTIGTLID